MTDIYYTGSLTPESSGGEITVDSALSTTSTNPVQNAVITNTINGYHENEIPDGTVIEGKFSDLPTFFASLEGKYCKGTVTYKVTEDETVNDRIYNNIYPFNIPNLVIDGNDKTLTLISPSASNHTFFLTATNTNALNLLSITLTNINFILGASSYTGEGISCFSRQLYINVKNCSFSNYNSVACTILNGTVQGCEFTGNATALRGTAAGTISSYLNVFTNNTTAIYAQQGAFIADSLSSFTNNTNKYKVSQQGFTTGIVYQS